VVQTLTLLEKFLQVREQLPRVEILILMNPEGVDRGLPGFHAWQDVLQMGRLEDAASLQSLQKEHREEREDRVVTYIYTSGTTGPPKGAMLTHANFLSATRFYGSVLPVDTGESGMSFLPLAHALQRVLDYLILYVGATIYYARDLTTVREDLLSANPTAMGSVPRIFEKIYAGVQKQAAEKGPAAQRLFRWSVDVGRRMSRCWQRKERPGLLLTLQYQLAYRLVLSKIKRAMGGRIRVIGSGGAPISTEIQEFFHACGILILEAWGMTETTALGTLTRPDAYKFGTVGRPADGVRVRLDEDGEILIQGPCVFAGYYKDPELTAESFVDGWLRTGDVGTFDEEGFLKITDRKKDLIITGYGKNIAPQNIENALKTSRYISQAMVYGDRQKYLVALLTLDPDEGAAWASRQGIQFSDPSDLASNPRVREQIQAEVERINRELATFENVRKFELLPRDFSIEAGELTPTLKVKRKVVRQKYLERIQGIYGKDWMPE
jgi:long-chain acyl-CoA synthetase